MSRPQNTWSHHSLPLWVYVCTYERIIDLLYTKYTLRSAFKYTPYVDMIAKMWNYVYNTEHTVTHKFFVNDIHITLKRAIHSSLSLWRPIENVYVWALFLCALCASCVSINLCIQLGCFNILWAKYTYNVTIWLAWYNEV